MTHHLRRFVITGILIAIGIALGVYWSKPKPVLVQVQAVERGVVEATVANTRAGTVKACRRAKMSPPMGGLIDSLPVKKGDAVKAGQLLLALWNHDIEAEILLAQRNAAAAQARATQACVVAQVSRREANRLKSLKAQHLASEEQAERAEGDAQANEAACKAAKEAKLVEDARINVSKEALERTVLRAPFAGNIAEINGEVGEYVTPSPPGIPTLPAIDLIDNSCLYISAPIDEVDAPAVKLKQPVRISLDAFPGEYFAGQVRRIAPYVLEIEKQARTVEVEADFTNPADYARLLAGYSADLEIVLDTRKDVLRIPTDTLLEGNRVLVFDTASGTLQSRQVKPGLSNWKLTEVVSGLQEGEQVVTTVDRKGVEPGALAALE